VKRRAITTAWVILSTASGIVSWGVLYAMYVFLFAPFVDIGDTAVSDLGGQIPQLVGFWQGLYSDMNAAFIIVGVGIFVFFMVLGFLFEPQSQGVALPE
jgi:hypothetical protein